MTHTTLDETLTPMNIDEDDAVGDEPEEKGDDLGLDKDEAEEEKDDLGFEEDEDEEAKEEKEENEE